MLSLEPTSATTRCPTCIVDAARQRLAGRARAVPRSRLARLVRRAGAALAIGVLASVPLAELAPAPSAQAFTLAALPPIKLPARQPGYQLATEHGDVQAFGAAVPGTPPATPLNRPVTAVARTRTGAGAWTATADGGVLTSGDARFFGSLGGRFLNQPVVGVAGTASGEGYWLTSADGGVFAFGDAVFHGSLVGRRLNAPVVQLVPTPSGDGYWLATADGGVFTFGDATFRGAVGRPVQGSITSMAATPTGRGYWLAGADGGVFAYGDAAYLGRPAPEQLRSPVVGIAASRSGQGYWLAAADGGVFSYGDAPFLGSSGATPAGRVVGITAGPSRVRVAAAETTATEPTVRAADLPQQAVLVPPAALVNRYGNDISWPQCDGPVPGPGYGFGIVGATGGRPFTHNRCLGIQWKWATSGASAGAIYVNLASPIYGGPAAMQGPAGACSPVDLPCQTYNDSANNVLDALAYARSVGVEVPMVWLDVEVLNRWTANDALNALTVKAAAETLQHAGLRAGVYSTPYMWRVITGGDRNGLPVWVAGAPTDAAAPAWCDDPAKNFTGGGVWLVQSLPVAFDVNYACAPALADQASLFHFDD